MRMQWRVRFNSGGDQTIEADEIKVVTGHLCFMLARKIVFACSIHDVESIRQWVP